MADDQRQGPTGRAASTARKAKGAGIAGRTRASGLGHLKDQVRYRYRGRAAVDYLLGYFGPPETVGPHYRRRTIICQVTGLAVGLFVTLPMLHYLFDRDPVFRMMSISIEPDRVVPGQAVHVVLHGTEFRDCDGTIHRQMIDSAGRVFTYQPERRNLGQVTTDKPHIYRLPLVIPLGMGPGEARYKSTIYRWCNRVQKLLWQMTSTYEASFDVIGKADQN